MKGQIFKIHSDFYYANTENGIFECKVRDVLKKQKVQIFVGDYVELEQINNESKQAFICKILTRENYIPRPKVANITQIVIVSALKEPELDFEQLNRYLCFCEYYKLNPVLCFNKNDLEGEEDTIKEIKETYIPLGYKVLFTSAIEKIGIDQFKEILKNNITVLCGSSGVGKSSLINAIKPGLQIKTKAVSEKTERGTHTTRHCEIISLDEETKIVDTPGFSQLRFDFLMPSEINNLFREFVELKPLCKFSDCLHETEIGCNVIENLDKINNHRYESYLQFVKEAKEYKNKITYNGKKTESRAKTLNNREVTKISNKKRQISRRKTTQDTQKEY